MESHPTHTSDWNYCHLMLLWSLVELAFDQPFFNHMCVSAVYLSGVSLVTRWTLLSLHASLVFVRAGLRPDLLLITCVSLSVYLSGPSIAITKRSWRVLFHITTYLNWFLGYLCIYYMYNTLQCYLLSMMPMFDDSTFWYVDGIVLLRELSLSTPSESYYFLLLCILRTVHSG